MVRRHAVQSLSYLDRDAWAAIREALQDEDSRARAGGALVVLHSVGGKASRDWPLQEKNSVVPILQDLLNDHDPEVGRNAQRALEGIASRSRTIVGP